MLVTQQKVLRRFWYPTVPLAALADGPRPFHLLGESLVLWKTASGALAAMQDRCCHRTARLSKGKVQGEHLACGYHGWEYNVSGQCVRIPQQPDTLIPQGARVPAFAAQEKYGLIWVALETPLRPILDIPEDHDSRYRRIHQFNDRWRTGALRLMENSFDAAHFPFVHRGAFGQFGKNAPEFFSLRETDYGFEAETKLTINNPVASHRITGSTAPTIQRHFRNRWHLPFTRRLGLYYPNGLEHLIITSATPVDDQHIELIQWLYRNDKEADCSADELNEWDLRVIAEDKEILEATDPDAPVDIARRDEENMQSDRPGILMRQRLFQLLKEHGETETRSQTHAGHPTTRAAQVLVRTDAFERPR